MQFADVSSKDRRWHDVVQVTSPSRTIEDCAERGISIETLGLAVHQALSRHVVSREEIPKAIQALEHTTSHPVAA
jgi:hypothetical protein